MDSRPLRIEDPLVGDLASTWLRRPSELSPELVARGLLLSEGAPARLVAGGTMTPALIPWVPRRRRKLPRTVRIGGTDVEVLWAKDHAGSATLHGVTYRIAKLDLRRSALHADGRLLATASRSLVSPRLGRRIRWENGPTGPDEHAMAHVLLAIFGIGTDADWPEFVGDLVSGLS